VDADWSGSGLKFAQAGRYLLVLDDRLAPDFEGGYAVVGDRLTPNSTWGAPADLAGLSEAAATARIQAAARFVGGAAVTHHGRGPAEYVLQLPLPDESRRNGERLHRLVYSSQSSFVGTVVTTAPGIGWDGTAATRVQFMVDRWLFDRLGTEPPLQAQACSNGTHGPFGGRRTPRQSSSSQAHRSARRSRGSRRRGSVVGPAQRQAGGCTARPRR
jgi:hypothetical protein